MGLGEQRILEPTRVQETGIVLSRKTYPHPLSWEQGAFPYSCPTGEALLTKSWCSWPQETTQPALSPGHKCAGCSFCLPLTVTPGPAHPLSPCLLLPTLGQPPSASPAVALALSLIPCCTWPQLFACILPCNPHSGSMRAGAGVRVSHTGGH